jgi:hypothetical protein
VPCRPNVRRGTLRVTGLRDSNLTFWTLTVWSNEQSMRAFMLSGPHKRAIAEVDRLHGPRRTAEWLRKAGSRGSSTRPTHNGPSASLRRMYRGSLITTEAIGPSEAQLTVVHYKLI